MSDRMSIGDAARHLGLEPDTLRYYERKGIVPAPTKDSAGHRVYTETQLHLLEVLLHLKSTGMPLVKIAAFTRLVASDPDGVPERLDLLRDHREQVIQEIESWQHSLRVINRKIEDYNQRLGGHGPQ